MNQIECSTPPSKDVSDYSRKNSDLKDKVSPCEEGVVLGNNDHDGLQWLIQQQQQVQVFKFKSYTNKNNENSKDKTNNGIESEPNVALLSSLKSANVANTNTKLLPITVNCMTSVDMLPAKHINAQLEAQLIKSGAENDKNNVLGVITDGIGEVNGELLKTSAHPIQFSSTAPLKDVSQFDFGDALQREPLCERWSPLGANYDDVISLSLEPFSPEPDFINTNSHSVDKQELVTENLNELARLRSIEEEQELLTSSLMALTSHFAHVQLRVRQIVEAPLQERDQLLKDLEDFAFQGIPEPAVITTGMPYTGGMPQMDLSATHSRNESQGVLVDQMNCQLNELNQIAYKSNEPLLPHHILLEKQKIIIDELKRKLNLQVNDSQLPQLSAEQLRNQVDYALGEFVGPLKMKEKLVTQLKTQITDLERFIAFLQCDSDDNKLKILSGEDSIVGGVGSEKLYEAYNSYAAKKKQKQQQVQKQDKGSPFESKSNCKTANSSEAMTTFHNTGINVEAKQMFPATAAINGGSIRENLNNKAHGLLDKASLLMQMFASMHFIQAKSEQFQKNSLKKTSKGNHWGDLRAQLEVDIQEVASLAATLNCDREKLALVKLALKQKCQTSKPRHNICNATKSTSLAVPLQPHQALASYSMNDPANIVGATTRLVHMRGDSIATISRELTQVVRKNFAKTLQHLLQHGLRVEKESSTAGLIVPFMRCLNPIQHSRTPSPSSHSATSLSEGYIDNAPIGQYAAATQQTSFLAAHMPGLNAGEMTANYDDVGHSNIFGCGRPMHAWQLILEYYYLKHGEEYNNTPARKLSQSFNLDIVDAQAVSAKQSLLSTIGMIMSMHRPYKRSFNAHFKAFVSAGLNAHLLVEWLNLILSCNELIDVYYAPNSYVACTGFRDSLRSIDVLTKYDYDLPVDLAIRHFNNV